jgi:hypothetical protein
MSTSAMSPLTADSAVLAYLNYLKLKGVADEVIAKRKRFVSEVANRLHQRPQMREVYAETLNQLMHDANQPQWLFDVTVAREFYPFWMEDVKAIARLRENLGFDVQSIAWKPLPTTLKSLSIMLESEVFSEQESVLLERYLQSLHQQVLPRHVVLVQLKLAKIMLLRLRDAPIQNNLVYRMAVDLTLPLFRQKKSRQLFLKVVREFFYLWMEQTDKN